MRFWPCVITKLAKKNKGAVVRNSFGHETVLVSFTKSTLVEIDFDEEIIHGDRDNTPWATEGERQFAVVGAEIIIASETDYFPKDQQEIQEVNFRYAIDMRFNGHASALPKGRVILIYHDFVGEGRKGDSGGAFAAAVAEWYEKKLFKKVYFARADMTMSTLLAQLAAIKVDLQDNAFVDTILIATHGSSGQLWLGNPEDIKHEDVIAPKHDRKNFASAQAFGAQLQKFFGSNLGVGIYSCDFVGDVDGHNLALELRAASAARVVYAGKGTVFFNATLGDRPTVQSEGGYSAYYEGRVEVYGNNLIPVFDL